MKNKNQEELKTLKDLKKEFNSIEEIILFNRVRQEAIKWVKVEDWEDFWKWLLNKKGIRFGDCVGVELACYLLEYIFNLTEEDLKNE